MICPVRERAYHKKESIARLLYFASLHMQIHSNGFAGDAGVRLLLCAVQLVAIGLLSCVWEEESFTPSSSMPFGRRMRHFFCQVQHFTCTAAGLCGLHRSPHPSASALHGLSVIDACFSISILTQWRIPTQFWMVFLPIGTGVWLAVLGVCALGFS